MKALLAALLLLSASPFAQSLKLNAPLAVQGGAIVGDVRRYASAPDGEHVVYLADGEVDEKVELYSVALVGARRVVKLNSPLSAGRKVTGFLFTPDGKTVLYRADERQFDKFELYAARVDGSSTAIRLSGTASTIGYLVGSPSGVPRCRTTPDGSWAVYLSDQNQPLDVELYGVPIDGSSDPVQLTGVGSSVGHVQDDFLGQPSWRLSPDGLRVLYVADHDVAAQTELYSVLVDGSAPPVKLNEPLVPGSNVDLLFALTPDSITAVYGVDRALHSVPSDGSAAPIDLQGHVDQTSALVVSPDSTAVSYFGSHPSATDRSVLRTRLDGSQTLQLSGPVPSPQMCYDVAQTRSGERIVYRSNVLDANHFELFSAPRDGSEPAVRLSGSLPTGGHVLSFQLDSVRDRVVYLADQTSDEVFGLYSAPVDGSTPAVALNGALPAGGDVLNYVVRSGQVVYRADQEADDLFAVFTVPSDASRAARRVSDDLIPGGDVISLEMFGAARVLYLADQDVDGVNELYLAFAQAPTLQHP